MTMKRYITLFAVAALLCGCVKVDVDVPEKIPGLDKIPGGNGGEQTEGSRHVYADEYRVQKVLDGRRFVIIYDGDPTGAVLHGIRLTDAEEAADELGDMIEGRIVRIEFPLATKRDRRGRLVVRAYREGQDVAARLVRDDLAEWD